MLFSSILFLFLFLPVTLIGYYLVPKKVKNYWLLLLSLVFFGWGGINFTYILLVSILLNYFFGLLIEKNIETKAGYTWLFVGVFINLLILGVFKYANFVTHNVSGLLKLFSLSGIKKTNIVLPIGISFYTFHSISYLVDIYRRKTLAQHNIFDLSLYICMFSQLIAGPIIRYSDVWKQLKERTHTISKFSSGVERFVIGLAKKVLLANTFAKVADDMFANNISDLVAVNAWLGIICYSLQIYYDFAGYSDMAIGLGRMFGFEFLENFNLPYVARSVKEFWRRWHISLSSFFRDYVYIPLGGNRATVKRTYVNLILVFFLTGFWHGASWTFILWGLIHGFFMVVERLGFEKILEKIGRPIANIYTILVVMFAWVLFRSETLSYALDYWGAMFNFSFPAEQLNLFFIHMDNQFYAAFVIGILGALGFFNFISKTIDRYFESGKTGVTVAAYSFHVSSVVFYMSIILFCSMYLLAGTYNPFIYYRF